MPPESNGAHGEPRLNLLFLYDQYSVPITTVYDHLACFGTYGRHEVSYASATGTASCEYPLDAFDAVVLHYSVRLCVDAHLSPAYARALQEYGGLKALFIQDEYDHTWKASDWINKLGIGLVFTCVPQQHVRDIYSRVDHERTDFVTVLTGYLPLESPPVESLRPIKERPIVVGYRGRELPFRYGRLAREKLVIGQKFRTLCHDRGVAHDIEWTEDKRIYGDAWFDFIAGSRATLGAESGSNVFDFDGTLTPRLRAVIERKPKITFDEVFDQHLASLERDGLMNQISPRVFEAVALKTALVLFEGDYSGVVAPHEHYIPLKKDFSNVDEVFAKLADVDGLQAMVERAYAHVVGSGKYTYARFVRSCERAIEARIGTPRGVRLIARVVGLPEGRDRLLPLEHANIFTGPVTMYERPPQTQTSPDLLGLCQGRLTTARGLPFVAQDGGSEMLYFTPCDGNRVALHTRGHWQVHRFDELTLPLGHLHADTNYDVFLHEEAGTLALATIAWKDDRRRERALLQHDGVWVLARTPGHRYLGTIRTVASGLVEDSDARRFVWNHYNRCEKSLSAHALAEHAYAGAGARLWADDPAFHFAFVLGQPQYVGVELSAFLRSHAPGAPALAYPALDGATEVRAELGRYVGNYNTQFAGLATAGGMVLAPGYHTVGAGQESNPAGATYAAAWLRGAMLC